MSPANPNRKPGSHAPFPVLEERALPAIPRRMLRVARRDLGELPAAQPGTVLVFHYGSRYHAFTEAKPLTGTEEPVVDASSVFLVTVRPRQFTIQFAIPSARPAEDFTIRTMFIAQVTSAEQAAATGPIDMTSYLANYLQRDKTLLQLGRQYQADNPLVRDYAASRIEAYCELHPIELPGLSIQLDVASVMINPGVRIHDHKLLSEERRQQLGGLEAQGQDTAAARYQGYVEAGSGALTALGLAQGETAINDAIGAAHQTEARHEDKLAELMRIYQENGLLDHVDIDPTDMLNAYVEKITGKPLPDSAGTAIDAPRKQARHAISSSRDNPHDEPVNEADLDF